MTNKLSAIDKLNLALENKGNKEEKEIKNKYEIKKININFSENKEENKFLENKINEVFKIQINASLELGRIFTEVSEKVEEGMYCKWLEIAGYNRVSAFRHRRRYELYQLAITKEAKENIAMLTFREIENFYKNKEENIKLINEGISIEELKNKLLMNKNLTIEKEVKNTEFNFNIFKNLKKELKTLDSEKQQKVKVLLEEIEKVING
ncbi:MAG: hypothetical protein MJH09_03685 [Cetobacterium sp.]|nr:hypothetical protein [Cetobacterium sp.]